MSESDLRPRDPARQPAPQPMPALGKRWWGPLASPYGIIALIIVVGLAIGLYENVASRFFPGSVKPAPVTDIFAAQRAVETETAKLDAAATGEVLRAALSSLPGADPKKTAERIQYLAIAYNRKWRREDDALKAKISPAEYAKIKTVRDADNGNLSSQAIASFGQPPPLRKAIPALQQYIGRVSGDSIQEFTDIILRRVQDDMIQIARIPDLRMQIEGGFEEAKLVFGQDRWVIRDRVGRLARTYAYLEKIRREFPSTEPDPLLDTRRKEAKQKLYDATGSMMRPTPEKYEAASKVIVESLPYATEDDMEQALRSTFQ
ncbi:hypothetical protein [Bradyrhizobium sp.]